MQDNTLPINFAPIVGFLLSGAVVTAVAILLWWLKTRHNTPHAMRRSLTVLAVFLCCDLIIFGAFTRLTDSGLGCPDWPGCYGHATPVGASQAIDHAYQQMPTGPVSPKKAWIEMIHRYLATGLGLLIVMITAHTWWRHLRTHRTAMKHDKGDLFFSTLSLFWVIMVGIFGALTVTLKLYPAIVTLHLLGAMALLMLLTFQTTRSEHIAAQHTAPKRARWLACTVCVLLWMQIALGGWVSTNYAVLACNTFPLCQGSWWPTMNFTEGFTIWRPLGQTSSGQFIDFTALVAIHYTHRLMAYLVIAAMLLLAWTLRTHERRIRILGYGLAAIAIAQLATGLANVVLDWPLSAALLHTTGAALAIILITRLLCLLLFRPIQVPNV